MRVILASASPRRQELLKEIYPQFEVKVADIDETLNKELNLRDALQELAKRKALAVNEVNTLIIAADTIVVLNEEILGKPHNDLNAKAMLKKLNGKTHQVYTAYCLLKDDLVYTNINQSDVTFYEMSNSEINDYIQTKEPLDKAGAYGIQGHGQKFIKEIKGDYYSIMGLPVSQLYQDLKRLALIS